MKIDESKSKGLLVFGLIIITLFLCPSPEGLSVQAWRVFAVFFAVIVSFILRPFPIGVMVMLGLHLYHGIWSLFQTLGLDNPDRNNALRTFAVVMTVALTIGFIVVPLAFMFSGMLAPVEYAHDLLTEG